MPHFLKRSAATLMLTLLGVAAAQADTPEQLLAGYSAQAGVPASPQRGQQFFNRNHGQSWQCSSCHGVLPTQAGQHAATAKPIQPLAPAFNPARFSDSAKVEKWFGRNCKDVLARACTPSEKADVLSWLLTLKP